jgi:hypothetical protein
MPQDVSQERLDIQKTSYMGSQGQAEKEKIGSSNEALLVENSIDRR